VEVLGAVTVPTLVVNGERDALIGRPDSFAGAIPQAELKLVPGDHVSAVVRREFRQAIVRFLSEH
jgi:pimeloyl-ACP methyl ester carboxylesterase